MFGAMLQGSAAAHYPAWLLFLQETLDSKGFGTDLPCVNAQVDEHNIFHNEVMAIGPHISKDDDKVSPRLFLASVTWARESRGMCLFWLSGALHRFVCVCARTKEKEPFPTLRVLVTRQNAPLGLF